ncbi:MAG: hypothetical protein ACFFBD_21665 [Candidatus Hodarchaeota archaeon]
MNWRLQVPLLRIGFCYFIFIVFCLSLLNPVSIGLGEEKKVAKLTEDPTLSYSTIPETGKIKIWQIGELDHRFDDFSKSRNISNFWVDSNTSKDFPCQIWGPDELTGDLGTAGNPNENNPLNIFFSLASGSNFMSHVLHVNLVRCYGSIGLEIRLNDESVGIYQLQESSYVSLNLTLPASVLLREGNKLSFRLFEGESIIFDALAVELAFYPAVQIFPSLKVAFIRPSWYPPRQSENLLTQTYQTLKNSTLFGSVTLNFDFKSFGTNEVTLEALELTKPDILVISYHSLYDLPHFLSEQEVDDILTYCQQGHSLLGIGNLFASQPEILGNQAINRLRSTFGLRSNVSLNFSPQNIIDEFEPPNHSIFSIFNGSTENYSPIQQYTPDSIFSVSPINGTWIDSIFPNVTLFTSKNQKGAIVLNRNLISTQASKSAYFSFSIDYQESVSDIDLDLQILFNTFIWLSPRSLLSGSLVVTSNGTIPPSLVINQDFTGNVNVEVKNRGFDTLNISSAYLERHPYQGQHQQLLLHMLYFSPNDSFSRLIYPHRILKPGESITGVYPIIRILGLGFASLVLNYIALDPLNRTSTSTSVELHFLSYPRISEANMTPSSFTLSTISDIFPVNCSIFLDSVIVEQSFIIEFLNSSSRHNRLNTTFNSLELISTLNTPLVTGESFLEVEISLNAPRNIVVLSTLFLQIYWQYQSLNISIVYLSQPIAAIYGKNNYEDYYIPFIDPPYLSTTFSLLVVISWFLGIFICRWELKNKKKLFRAIGHIVKSEIGQEYLQKILRIDTFSEQGLKTNIRRITAVLISWMVISLLIIIGLQSATTIFDFWLLNDVLFEIINPIFGLFIITVVFYFLWIKPKPKANSLEKIRQMMHDMTLRDLVRTASVNKDEYEILKKEIELLKSLEGLSDLNNELKSRKTD